MSSITDSTTSLDTTWTEQSIPTFTTGVLSDIDACVDEVEAKLRRGTLSSSTAPTLTQVKNWLKRAKLELVEHKGFTFTRKYAYADLTADTYRYALPPDYNGGEISIRDTSNDRYIAVWPENWFDKRYPDPSEEESDEVIVACVKNMELWFAPPPAETDRIQLEYSRSGVETTTDDFSWLPELERFRCCDFAIAEAFDSIHMWEIADRYWNKWNQGLVKSRRNDGRRKWMGKRNQAINVFQEHKAIIWQGGRYYRPD